MLSWRNLRIFGAWHNFNFTTSHNSGLSRITFYILINDWNQVHYKWMRVKVLSNCFCIALCKFINEFIASTKRLNVLTCVHFSEIVQIHAGIPTLFITTKWCKIWNFASRLNHYIQVPWNNGFISFLPLIKSFINQTNKVIRHSIFNFMSGNKKWINSTKM